MYDEDENGRIAHDYGRLSEEGAEVDRVRRITRGIVPGYLRSEDFRVYVIDNKDWNAMAAPNRSIYVFNGLLRDMSDDEVAIVLGHELAHATHEHSRKQFKKQILIQLAALGVVAGAESIDNSSTRIALQAVALIGATAWSNGYGRSHEDQADRVGLRYAFEGGYDVQRGPELWMRFARKYGEGNKIVNFFFSDHSQSLVRARNLERELALNYR
jgi:Zn-dependent protease with chaperone function